MSYHGLHGACVMYVLLGAMAGLLVGGFLGNQGRWPP